MTVVNDLRDRGLIADTLGTPPDNELHPGLIVWARKPPKDPFLAFIALAQKISTIPLAVFVDDLCARAVMERTEEDQRELNTLYRRFFEDRGCVVRFSSELYAMEVREMFSSLLSLGNKVSFGEFFHCLPSEKRESFSLLRMDEMFHMLFELRLLMEAQKTANVFLAGEFSRAILAAYHHVGKGAAAAIMVPRLSLDGIHRYIEEVTRV